MQSCAEINKSFQKGKIRLTCHCKRKQASNKLGGKSTTTKQPETTITQTLQPRVVQISKRRQSGKRPVADHADLVVVQIPAPASNRVSKRRQSHRSPKITLTAQTPGPPSLISPIYPLPIRIGPCIVCSSHAFADAFPVPNAHRQSRKQTPKSPSSCEVYLHVVF